MRRCRASSMPCSITTPRVRLSRSSAGSSSTRPKCRKLIRPRYENQRSYEETSMATMTDRDEGLVNVYAAGVMLEGNLIVPRGATGIVLFAHGSGSSRFSSRNRYVAEILRQSNLGTLLIDLLTQQEELVDTRTAHLRFDIDLLARRLVGATEWLGEQHPDLKVGLFGASTGGGAALVGAAEVPDRIAAVVSRGGRPDLAGDALPLVKAPTLLIVGGH